MEMQFTLNLKQIPIEIIDEQGAKRTFTLKELTGAQRDKFLDDMASRMKYIGIEVQGLSRYEGLQAALLSLCLYDDEDKLIPAKVIQSYPASMVSTLFDRAQSLSGLAISKKELDEIKNELGAKD